MKITEAFLEKHKTKRGAYTKAQMELIGVSWPPKKGWKEKVIGRELTKEQEREFIKAKNRKSVKNKVVKEKKAPGIIEFEINHIKNNYGKITERQYEYINAMLDKMPYEFNRELLMDISIGNAGSLISLLKGGQIVIFKYEGEIINDVDALLDYMKEKDVKQDSLLMRWISLFSKMSKVYGEAAIKEYLDEIEEAVKKKFKEQSNLTI